MTKDEGMPKHECNVLARLMLGIGCLKSEVGIRQMRSLHFAVTNRRSGRYGNTSGVSPSRSFRCTLRQKSG